MCKPLKKGLMLSLLLSITFAVGAQTVEHESGTATPLSELIRSAKAGATIILSQPYYTGPVIIDKPLRLIGRLKNGKKPIVDGQGTGTTITVDARNVVIENIEVINSGKDIGREESGIAITEKADNAHITMVTVRNCGFGIWLRKTKSPVISKNIVIGQPEVKMMEDLGNSIHLFDVRDALIEDNQIRQGRDGIYISNSQGSILRNNTINRTRFGIHYMYSHSNQVSDNRVDSSSVGLALMYSKTLDIFGNSVSNSVNHGILLRTLFYSEIYNNTVTTSFDGIAFSGCSFDTLRNNLVQDNKEGIIVSDSRKNLVYENTFINNKIQLNFQDNVTIPWGHAMRGNYWNDYVGRDANQDGLGDMPHYPAGILSFLVTRYPTLKVIMKSPAMMLLQSLESKFPAIRPAGVIEPYPLIKPATSTALLNENKTYNTEEIH